MLATLERVEILQCADELAQMVFESEVGENYLISLYKLQNDAEAQSKIKAFTEMKERYEEVQRFGRYHPDYKYVNLETRTRKRDLDLHPTVAEFKVAENKFQETLDQISVIIARSVSTHIKTPAGNPFFEGGCSSGGCGSGGSCGCS
ncbi:YlbF family regulator [Bacillus massiliigorillae]|uniref:YlbF family regulator n=1 Tax=Bacillus massiliigorillae TaxID=1243664 RepID=UPI0003A0EF31|nr:YlbF family regulator [Bacillus massiliigorillae]